MLHDETIAGTGIQVNDVVECPLTVVAQETDPHLRVVLENA